jgi:hypothetical protein
MFAEAHKDDFVSDHGSKRNTHTTAKEDKKSNVKLKFKEMGVELKYVVVFPHVDFFNGRHPSQTFLGVVSCTLIDSRMKEGRGNPLLSVSGKQTKIPSFGRNAPR